MGGAIVVTANDKRFKKLPPEIQTIIKEVALEYEKVGAKQLNNRQIKGLENLKNSGATVPHEPGKCAAMRSASMYCSRPKLMLCSHLSSCSSSVAFDFQNKFG